MSTPIDPTTNPTAEAPADGKLLEDAITTFNAQRNETDLLALLRLLRDSYVWVPCNVVLSDADQARLEALVAGMQDDPDGLVGKDFVAHDQTRMVPDILQSGEEFYFPVFTSQEAMGEYGRSFSKVQCLLTEAITLAGNNDRALAGIVVNAFSEPFVLAKELWGVLEKPGPQLQ